MLDSSNGWALTQISILKTADGGLHWKDVTPSNASLNMSRGDFLNTQYAWVAIPQVNANQVIVLHTTNGGQTWTSSTITGTMAMSVDAPHFLNTQEGWLEAIGDPGAGQQGAEIFHSIDGGVHWQKIASTENPASGLSHSGFKSGISFVNATTGYATTSSNTGLPTDAGLFVTHDGGHTWQKESFPMPQNINFTQIGTTPPVFFGNSGVMPVALTLQSGQRELILYRTNDNGNHWMQTRAVPVDSDASAVYVLDTNHAWTSDVQNGKFYYTNDGGTTWWPIATNPGKLNEMSFVSTNTGWAIISNALLHTADGGKTWTAVNYIIQ